MPRVWSYNEIVGRPVMNGAPTEAPTAPQLSVTGQGPNSPDSQGAGAASMRDWRNSPSVWFLILLFSAVGIAHYSRILG